MEIPLGQSDLERRFSGLERLYGVSGAKKIRAAHVLVIGVGGVGSWAAEALARSGVQSISLIDMDHVAESNINRQVHALSSTLGMAKVQAMQERIQSINPDCRLQCIDDFATPENWPHILPPGVDAVIDCCDSVKTKIALAAWSLKSSALFVTVGAAGGKRLAHQVEISDLANVSHDPLLAKVRSNLRRWHNAPKQGKRIGVQCVYSQEAVKQSDASCDTQSDGSLNCHGYGSVVAVTATFGMCAAGWVIDRISGKS